MPINRLIAQGSFDLPEIERLQEAYEITLKTLCLVDRNDPLTEIGGAEDHPGQRNGNG